MNSFKEFYNNEISQDIDEELLNKYVILNHLNETDNSCTYLISHKTTKIKYILKVYISSFQKGEYKVLSNLNHDSIPRIIDAIDTHNSSYIIEEFFEGTALSEFTTLKEKEIMSVFIKMCEILRYTHSQNPPVIHRDIKPQNIIITNKKEVKLIDFGSSREYNSTKDNDTTLLGTKGYASPEQYGFMETDIRADIFSLGVTMKDTFKKNKVLISSKFSRILNKCSEIDPKKRYNNVTEIIDDINGNKSYKKPTIAIVCILSLMITLVFYQSMNSNTYNFQSELIGQAVSMQLNKDIKGITIEDLKEIEELIIYGNNLVSSSEDVIFESAEGNYISAIVTHDIRDTKRGSIDTLEDLKYMENLYTLSLVKQNITDLSPLKDLNIVHLFLNDNKIANLDPLKGYTQLYTLEVGGNPINDFSAVENMNNLGEIDFSDTDFGDFSIIEDKKKLKLVILKHLGIVDISFLSRLYNLERLNLENNNVKDLSPLITLDKLRYLNIADNPTEDMDSINNSNVKNIVIRNTMINEKNINKNINILED